MMATSQAAGTRIPVEVLFTSWRPSLFRYALRWCGAPEMAEDLVQEAFLALCRKSVQGDEVRDPRLWTLCVVRHQISKHLRDQGRHAEELQPREVLEAIPADEHRPRFENDHSGDVRHLLSVLTPRERQVLLLRMKSLKYQQIAARLEISPKTAAALLSRALRKLQKAAGDAFAGGRSTRPRC